jgi:hypothetical protein
MCCSQRGEGLFLEVPVGIAVAFGLSLMAIRFILLRKESLMENPA